MASFYRRTISDWRRVGFPLLTAIACLCVLARCGLDQNASAREEKFVTVHLNDSLKRYDSVEISILAAEDTSKVIGKMWSGPLPDPGSVPSYRLDDAETRPLSIRVRGYDAQGALVMDMLISKAGGTQTIKDLPLPEPGKPSVLLSGLMVSPGSLTPAFADSAFDYEVALPYAESSLTVTASPAYSGAILLMGTDTLAAGKASRPISLRVGGNQIVLKVIAGTGTGLYAIVATRSTLPAPVDTGIKAWKFHRTIAIKINHLGMNPGGVIRNFPLLVRLTKENFDFTRAAAGGRDIRFTTADGRPLPFEVTRWESAGATGKADIWVRLDSIRTDDDSARILLHHGNGAAPEASDGAKVFGAADGYSGVWHLSEQGKGDPSEYRDATGRYHGKGGTGNGKNIPNRVEAIVGYGQDFQSATGLGAIVPGLGALPANVLGNTQGTINLPKSFDPGNDAWTFQGWVRRVGNTDGALFQKGDSWVAGDQRFQLLVLGGGGNQLAIEREGAIYFTNINLPEASFIHLGIVYGGGKLDLYADGFLRESKAWSQGGAPAGKALFGANQPDGSSEGFSGILDEPWFSNQVRSADWLRLSFETQKANAGIVVVGPF
ncbi:MAG: hypothetical protein JWP91_2819 [Fibrobacteres bacterium]|nr:hypothetical protein [Fibrobacterota bacterium]